jgi:transposase
MIRRIRIQEHAPHDKEAWQKAYYEHQKHWERRRLLALKAIWEGQNLEEVCRNQHVQRHTLTSWMDKYLHGGFANLLKKPVFHRKQLLSDQRQRIIRYMLLHKSPSDYGIDSYQWTASYMSSVIKQKWNITISCDRLYQLFNELGLSHQKVHRDYGPINKIDQACFIKDLKKNRIDSREYIHNCN